MHSEPEYFRIERLCQDNLGDLDRLYHAVYGEQRQPPDFSKKYATSWTGAEYLGYFAYDHENIPAAYYGVMPCLLTFNNQLLLAAQSGDTMTHPAHRGKGLFVRLGNMTIELCRQEKLRLLFGFPNQNSYSGAQKFGWAVTEHLDCFTIPVTTFPLPGLSKRLAFLSGLYTKYAAAILKNNAAPEQTIASSAIGENLGGIHRDTSWFQYKAYSDTTMVLLGKATVWLKLTDTFLVGDIETGTQDFAKTIRRLRRLAARLGHRRIFFHSSPGTPLHQLFTQFYKPVPSFPVMVIDLGANIPLHQLKFTSADLDIF
ncbi:MAG TPA: GNAT family N-acetyltransferase [Puia sp.]|jgi:GNAT superfamily N-acetyltransferase